MRPGCVAMALCVAHAAADTRSTVTSTAGAAPDAAPSAMAAFAATASDIGLAAGGVAVAGAFSGEGVGAALRLGLAVRGCAQRDYTLVDAPVPIVIEESAAFGAVVGNLLLVGGALAADAAARQRRRRGPCSPFWACWLVPSAPLLFFQWLYPGLARGAWELVLAQAGLSLAAPLAGIAGIAVCIAVPCWLSRTLAHVARSEAYVIEDRAVRHPAAVCLLGPGVWVTHRAAAWYGCALWEYRQDRVRFAAVDFAATLALAAIHTAPAAAQGGGGCGNAKAAAAGVLAAVAALEAYFWPYLQARASACSIVAGGVQAAAAGCLARAYYADDPNHGAFATARVLALFALGVVAARGACGVAAALHAAATGRRRRVEGEARGRGGGLLGLPPPAAPMHDDAAAAAPEGAPPRSGAPAAGDRADAATNAPSMVAVSSSDDIDDTGISLVSALTPRAAPRRLPVRVWSTVRLPRDSVTPTLLPSPALSPAQAPSAITPRARSARAAARSPALPAAAAPHLIPRGPHPLVRPASSPGRLPSCRSPRSAPESHLPQGR
eukprot:TRINITY_DN14563_c0_g1_i1.p1 TRINITY_DN14563_c0_g1~~TRINITY_DN14563_c0_g1_i1.p1  ORF type:complete len:551 (+),score=122.81 TRINITY_DN14563_c0_g1_i1:85-1737(+)